MANIGDIVIVNDLVCRVTAISEDATPLYTVQPLRKTETELKKTVDSGQSQFFLKPSDGDPITGLYVEALGSVSSTTAKAKAIADGYIRIAFNMESGVSFTGSYYQVIEEGAKATQPVAPTRDHYTFGGWYHDAEYTEAVNFAVDTFDVDTTLYDKWVIDTFTVTYDSNEGSAVASETVDYGSLATEPDDPTLASYLFEGWYTDDTTFEEPFSFDTPIVDDITLYANWDDAVIITFDSNEGSAVTEQTILVGALATEPDDPTLADNTFDGWYYDDSTFLEPVDFATDVFEADDTLYAKWVPYVVVTFDSNEGSAVEAQSIPNGSLATEPDDPTLADNRFDGWFYDDETFAEPVDFTTDVFEADDTLYAKWVVQVTVTFDSNEGSAVDSQVIDSGALATEPDDPTLAGNTFAGWFYDDATFLEPVDFAVDTFAADDTLYAKWDTEG